MATPTRSGARGSGPRAPHRALPAQAHDALLVLGAALLDDLDALADRLTVMVLQREPVYAELDLVEEMRRACRINMERGVQVFAERVPDGAIRRTRPGRPAARRARQGVPLESVLGAYRLGGRVMWESLLDKNIC